MVSLSSPSLLRNGAGLLNLCHGPDVYFAGNVNRHALDVVDRAENVGGGAVGTVAGVDARTCRGRAHAFPLEGRPPGLGVVLQGLVRCCKGPLRGLRCGRPAVVTASNE